MRKKYIQHGSGLLIGLLSLNTLSSCVHTSRGLGMGGNPSRHEEEGHDKNNSRQANHFNIKKVLDTAKKAALVGGVAAAAGTTGYQWGSYNARTSNTNSSNDCSNYRFNGTSSTSAPLNTPKTFTGVTPPYK